MTPINYKSILFKTLYKLGAFRIARIFSQNHLRILMYHRFGCEKGLRRLEAALFEEQLKILLKNFNVVSLDYLCTLLADGAQIPSNTVVITVDDGYEDFYFFAYPVLKKHSVPATLYITTEFVEQKIWLWPDLIEYILKTTKKKDYSATLNGGTISFKLTDSEYKIKAWNDIADHCLILSNSAKNIFIKELSRDMGVTVPDKPTEEYRALSWEQIYDMQRNGIDFGSHTCTHPKLTKIETQDELLYEIKASKQKIQERLDAEVSSFCYPNGTKADFNDNIKNIVKNAGYKNAVAAYFDINTYDDLFELPRYAISNDMMRFNKIIYGVEFLSRQLRLSSD